MREIMADMSDMFAMPRIGDSGNVYCPAVQLNLARPHLYDSSTYFFISIISLSYTYVFVSWGTYGSSIFWRYPHRRWRSAISIILHGHLLRSTRWLWSWSLPIRVWASGAVDRNIPKYPTHGPAMFSTYWTLASRALPPLLSSLTSDTLHLTWTFHSHPNTATFNGTTVHKNQNRNRVPRIWANVGKYLVFLLNALLDQ